MNTRSRVESAAPCVRGKPEVCRLDQLDDFEAARDAVAATGVHLHDIHAARFDQAPITLDVPFLFARANACADQAAQQDVRLVVVRRQRFFNPEQAMRFQFAQAFDGFLLVPAHTCAENIEHEVNLVADHLSDAASEFEVALAVRAEH